MLARLLPVIADRRHAILYRIRRLPQEMQAYIALQYAINVTRESLLGSVHQVDDHRKPGYNKSSPVRILRSM